MLGRQVVIVGYRQHGGGGMYTPGETSGGQVPENAGTAGRGRHQGAHAWGGKWQKKPGGGGGESMGDICSRGGSGRDKVQGDTGTMGNKWQQGQAL